MPTLRRRAAIRALALLAAALAALPLAAAEIAAETPPPRPGEVLPRPRQRRVDEIESLPVREAPCPACGYVVSVPRPDALMRGRDADGERPAWSMDAASRDADLCPYPGPGMVAFQADIAVCPTCGYARKVGEWDEAVPARLKGWIAATLTPFVREAQGRLLGKRGEIMDEAEIIAFFNRQEELPDSVRTELHRACREAAEACPLAMAEACWLAAWAARRETAAPPRAELFARHAAAVEARLARSKDGAPGTRARADALRSSLRRAAQSRKGLPGAEDMTGRLVLAGLLARLGFLREAEKTLAAVEEECGERFLRTDQDPLWAETAGRGPRSRRLEELEALRSDAAREAATRREMIGRERELLLEASRHIRRAIREGALDDSPEEALFHAYLVGEFLRRAGELPLASEWFRNLVGLAKPDSPLAAAAAAQLRILREEAGDEVNLLSALGRDGDLFARLLGVCDAGR